MIVIVMGMSKSGTTLISKTLHESGINMYPGKTGNYNHSKYEDPDCIEILLEMFNQDRLKSLYIPHKIKFTSKIQGDIKNYIASKKEDWGVKQPWLTLCYPEWKKFLPEYHIAIGIKRTFEGLISHWHKRNKNINIEHLRIVQNIYNLKMLSYGIPVLSFEQFIKNGPIKLEKIISRKLKDVRI